MRLLPPALLVLTLVAEALPAAAQPAAPSAAEEDRRTRLFKEGKAAADAGQWAEAADKFRQVVRIRSAPKALVALGVAEEKMGHLLAALAAYKQAREEAADKALTDDLKTANNALETIRPRVPRLTFSPSGALDGARLELDGAEARPESGVLLVDPGDHTIVATSTKGTFRTTVSLKERDQREIAVAFGAAAASSTGDVEPGGPPSDTGSAAPPTGAIVIAVAGVALAGAGAALFGVGSGEYEKSAKVCPGAGCTDELLASGNGGRTQIIVGDVLMIAGSVAIAGGVVWWIAKAASSGKKKDAQTSVFVSPRIGGIAIGGRF
jgi:tetratricopeptide (TPR) repeat protein